MSRRTDNGIPPLRLGAWYVVERPNGRRGTWAFTHPYRAAEHVMRAAHIDWWPTLFARGIRIVQVGAAERAKAA